MSRCPIMINYIASQRALFFLLTFFFIIYKKSAYRLMLVSIVDIIYFSSYDIIFYLSRECLCIYSIIIFWTRDCFKFRA